MAHLIETLPLPLLDLILLSLTSMLTSGITASMGIGGGAILLAVMANMLPPLALIPVHGMVQFGSNAGRAVMTRIHIDWQLVGFFFAGAVIGSLVGYHLLVQLPIGWLLVAVALFILFNVWGPKPEKHQLSNHGVVVAGAGTTILSLFVGATGPLVASYIYRQGYDRHASIATLSGCLTLQHVLKLVTFSAAGFVFWPWLLPIVAMIGCGLVGTWLGLKLLNRLPVALFQRAFRWILTVLALRLLWQAAAYF